MKAYMIMDFDNPVSVAYSKMSIESFKPVEDLIEIIPIQCTKPKDLVWIDEVDQWGVGPMIEIEGLKFSFWPHQLLRSGDRDWTEIEKSVVASHLKLWLKNEKKRFIIMEHDAYLLDEQKFRKDFNTINDYGVWMPGIAMECYSLSNKFKEYIRWYIEDKKWNTFSSGPMGYIEKLSREWKRIFPKDGKKNLLNDGSKAPVTQLYSKSLGITLDHLLPHKYEDQPNLYIID